MRSNRFARPISFAGILTLILFLAGSPAGHTATPPLTVGQLAYQGHVDGGVSHTVWVDGATAYIAEGPRLSIFDVSSPDSPVMLGQTEPLPAVVIDVEVIGGVAYVAYGGARAGLATVAVSNPAAPVVLGDYRLPDTREAECLDVDGTIAYLAGRADAGGGQVRTIDISDPANPVPLGRYATANYSYLKLFVAGTILYVADGPSLLILDISNPANPTLIHEYTGLARHHDIQVVGNLAYVAGVDGSIYDQGVLSILDVSNPAAPVEIGYYDAYPCGCMGIRVAGNRAYVTDHINAWVRIFDISNPANPVELGHYFPLGGYSSELMLAGNLAYLADDWQGGMQVVDVSNPAAPYQIAFYDRPGFTWEVDVQDEVAYVGHSDGLAIVDVGDPQDPVQLGMLLTPDYVRDVVQSGNYAYVSIDFYGVGVVDVSNPAAPVMVDTLNLDSDIKGVAQAGDMMYAVGWGDPSRVYVVDVSDPHDIFLRGTVNVNGIGFDMDMDVQGDRVYAASGYTGRLYIVDVSNPNAPAILGSYNTSSYGVDVVGDLCYVATGALVILDVSNPAAPVVLSTFAPPGGASQVSVVGGVAYTSGGYSGMAAVDVSDPYAPFLLDAADTVERATAIDGVGDMAYVADIDGGLFLFRYTDPARAGLEIAKAGPGIGFVGEPITYTLTVTNSGLTPLTGLVVSDTVPAGAFYVRGGTLLPGGVVEWTLAELAPGPAQFSFVVTATATITNSDYAVTCTEGLSATGEVTVVTVILARPDLALQKDGPAAALPGERITYTLAFSNVGALAAGVRLTDTLPLELDDIAVISSGAVLTPVAGTRYVWQVEDLPYGAGAVITIGGVLSGCLEAGRPITNTAILTAAHALEEARSTAVLHVLNAAPLAAADVYTGNQDTALVVPAPGVLGNDADGNCDALSAVLDEPPARGALGLNADGSLIYMPEFGFTGAVTFTYHAADGAASSDPALGTIHVVSDCQAVAIAGVDSTAAGCVVTFSATLAGDPPFTYGWDFGALGGSPAPKPTVDFGTSGTYPYTLTVGNCGGAYSDTAAGEVAVQCDSCVPVTQTTFSWTPLTPTAGQPVRFSGQAAGSAPITMTWGWSDGGRGSGPVVTHTLALAGTYTATLTATNGCGIGWVARQILVEEAALYRIYLPAIIKLAAP